jgi:hypothetical protein
MREYRVSRNIAAGRFAKDDAAVRFRLQEAYKGHDYRSAAILGHA